MEEKGKNSRKILKLPMSGTGMSVLVVLIAIAFTSLAVTPIMAQEAEVSVNAPEYVEEKKTFNVTIDVDDIEDFNTGQFDLTFEQSVVKVDKVKDGSIGGIPIPIEMWEFMERDTIRVMLMLSKDKTVSGSGYLAKITFKVEGDEGDECALEIHNGKLVKIVEEEGRETPKKISVDWIDAKITVGVKKEEEEEPPDVTEWDPTEAVVSSVEGELITFEITVDQIVDISWQINGSEVQTDKEITKATYTNTSVAVGTRNLSAIATNTATGLSIMHNWIWSVTPTSTEAPPGVTPIPTQAPEVTLTPTLAPEETPKPTATPEKKSTPKPTAMPEKKSTPTPVPGFEAVFAIAVMSAIAYILHRRK